MADGGADNLFVQATDTLGHDEMPQLKLVQQEEIAELRQKLDFMMKSQEASEKRWHEREAALVREAREARLSAERTSSTLSSAPFAPVEGKIAESGATASGGVPPRGSSAESGNTTSGSKSTSGIAGESGVTPSRSDSLPPTMPVTPSTMSSTSVQSPSVQFSTPVVANVVVTPSRDRVNILEVGGDANSVTSKNILKLMPFDGSTPIETHLMKLRNCSRHGNWSTLDRACALRNSTEGEAADLLNDLSEEATEEELICALQNRFGTRDQHERFCAELRVRRRRPGETIQALHQDVKRLLRLGYPGNTGPLYDQLSRDCLLETLGDEELRASILEKGAKNLEDVLHHVIRIEAIRAKPSIQAQVFANVEDSKYKRGARAVAADAKPLYEEPQSVVDSEKRIKALEEELRGFRREWRESASQPTPERSHRGSYGNKRPYQQGRGRGGGGGGGGTNRECYNCGRVGHISRDCPDERRSYQGQGRAADSAEQSRSSSGEGAGSGTSGGSGQKTGTASRVSGVSISGISSKAVDTYVKVDICGTSVLFLCDSGAEHNIIARKMVPRAKLTCTDIELYTASGQRLEVLGTVWLHFSINGALFEAEFLVTEQLCDAILGYQFLADTRCEWRFAKAAMVIAGREVKLVNKPTRANVRRVYTRERVSIAPDERCNIPVRMCFNGLRASPGNWMIDSKEIRPGVLVSRCLLPDVDRYAAVQVMNVSGKRQIFNLGLCLGDAELATVVKKGGVPSPTFGMKGQSALVDAPGQSASVDASAPVCLGETLLPDFSGACLPKVEENLDSGGQQRPLTGGLVQHLQRERVKFSGVSAVYSANWEAVESAVESNRRISGTLMTHPREAAVLTNGPRFASDLESNRRISGTLMTHPREAAGLANKPRFTSDLDLSAESAAGSRRIGGRLESQPSEAAGLASALGLAAESAVEPNRRIGGRLESQPSEAAGLASALGLAAESAVEPIRRICGSVIKRPAAACDHSSVESHVNKADINNKASLCSSIESSLYSSIESSDGEQWSASDGERTGCVVESCDSLGLSESMESAAGSEVRRGKHEHLQCIIDSLPAAITDDERTRAVKLLYDYSDIFSVSEFDVGCTDMLTASILTGSHPPIAQSLRRYPRAHLDLIDETVDGMCQAGICSESVSAWNFNIVLVNRPGNAVPRITLDLRALNNISYKDKFPLPKIRDCLDALAGNVYFSCLDISNSFQ